jgi:hypothetical protein
MEGLNEKEKRFINKVKDAEWKKKKVIIGIKN